MMRIVRSTMTEVRKIETYLITGDIFLFMFRVHSPSLFGVSEDSTNLDYSSSGESFTVEDITTRKDEPPDPFLFTRSSNDISSYPAPFYIMLSKILEKVSRSHSKIVLPFDMEEDDR